MNSSLLKRLLVALVAVVAVAAVAALAYAVGTNVHGDGYMYGIGPARMRGGAGAYWFDPLGLLALLALGALVVWFIVALVSGSGGRPSDFAAPGGVEKLKELADLHERGALSDDEFTAAKRKLLGL